LTNKMTIKTLYVSTLVLASLYGGQADAKLFDLSYSGIGGAGKFQVNADQVSPGNYNVETIVGVGNGSKITGLSPYASSDNSLSMPGQPYVSFSGLSFTTAADVSYNLYSWNNSYYQLSSQVDPIGYPQNGTPITLTAGVPEISTWAMMLTGFGFLGFAGYGRRKTARVSI